MSTFMTYNFAAPTTSIATAVTTGTALRTMLQVAPPSSLELDVIAWGVSYDGSTAGQVELIETDVAATVTAHVAAGIVKVDNPGGLASQVTLGAGANGFTASIEGTTTTSRVGDAQKLPAGGSYAWVLPKPFKVQVSKFLRVRVLFGTAVNMIAWVAWDE